MWLTKASLGGAALQDFGRIRLTRLPAFSRRPSSPQERGAVTPSPVGDASLNYRSKEKFENKSFDLLRKWLGSFAIKGTFTLTRCIDVPHEADGERGAPKLQVKRFVATGVEGNACRVFVRLKLGSGGKGRAYENERFEVGETGMNSD